MARPNVAEQLVDEVESLHLNERGYPASSFQEALATAIDMARPAELEEKGLAVQKAYPNDSGLNLARMHPETLDQLAIEPGGVVELSGERTTVAAARAMDGGDSRRGSIRIDGFTRGNAGIDVGNHVIVRAGEVETPGRVVFSHAEDAGMRLGGDPIEHVRAQVDGRVVSIDDVVPVTDTVDTPFDRVGSAVPLTVQELDPGLSRGRIGSETEIELVTS